MCEQCCAETVAYEGEVLPGYLLVRATKDGRVMKKDDWGLVHCNDPAFWWSMTPVPDPTDGMTDEQIDSLRDPQGLIELQDERYFEAAEHLDAALAGKLSQTESHCPHFDDATRLYEAAKAVGYDRDSDGRFAFWLCHHIGTFLKTAKLRAPIPSVP